MKCALVSAGILAGLAVMGQASAGPDASLCVDSYTMQGSAVPPGETGVWTTLAGCGTFMYPNDPATLVYDLCVGVNTFRWTVDDGATSTADQVLIIVYDPNMPPANAGPDTITVTLPQNSAQLSAMPPIYPATCQWTILTGPSIITDPTQPHTMVSDLAPGENIFLWTCENGPCWTAPTSDTLVIQMMLPSGIDESHEEPAFFTWEPQGQLLILKDNAQLEHVVVLDAQGREVRMTSSTGGRPSALSLAGQAAGVYLVRAVVDGIPQTARFVLTW